MPCYLDCATKWATIFAALGTVLVAVLAIWGDKVRARLAGPILTLTLRSPLGNLTSHDGKKTYYYHLVVSNERKWSPARSVRVMVVGISKALPDHTFAPEPLAIPVQLTWAFPQFREIAPTIADQDRCDLGYVDEGSAFRLSTYFTPNNFFGVCRPGERLRIHVKISADNYVQAEPVTFEISWDGTWVEPKEAMAKHLVVKPVIDKTNPA